MIFVVGGGPAGLATAYELQRRGLPYQVLERHSVGYTWQNHYDRLHLHTLKQVSALPGLPMPDDYPAFASATQLHAYLQSYAKHFQLNVAEGVDVQQADYVDRRWQITTNNGTLSCDTLIVATGIWNNPYCPKLPGTETFDGTIMHSNDYRNAKPFEGQRVLVVGSGNSGTEIAVDLSEHGATAGIAIRNGSTFVPYPRSVTAVKTAAWVLRNVPRPVGERLLASVRRDFRHIGIRPPAEPLMDAYPVVGFELPEAVEEGKVTVYGDIAQLVPGGVQFVDGHEALFDSIIMATGYRSTVQFVAHELDFDDVGRPKVDRYWRSTRNPNLICVGLHYPTTEGWLQKIGRVVHTAVKAL